MPDIRFIFSHAGRTLPMVAGRIKHHSTLPAFKGKVPNGFDYELKRLYYEITNAADKPSRAVITNMVPTSQIMFGTDFPLVGDRRYREQAEEPWAGAHRSAGDRARQCDRLVLEVEGVARRQVGRESRLGRGSRRFLRHPRGRDGKNCDQRGIDIAPIIPFNRRTWPRAAGSVGASSGAEKDGPPAQLRRKPAG